MGKYLVCEGSADGLDVRVLDLVLVNKLQCDIQIIPAGGDSELGSVARWLEERSRNTLPNGSYGASQDITYVIEDRNFRSIVEAKESWSQRKRWMWRRHEIENYLVDPRLVAEAFRALKIEKIRGAEELPDTSEKVLLHLVELALPMLEDHAGWVTYWHLDTYKRSTSETDTRLHWPDHLEFAPGLNYPGRAEWLSFLSSECQRLRQACDRLSLDKVFEEAAIVEKYDCSLSQINISDFLSSGQFLNDLGGKEIISALCSYVNRVGVSNLNREVLQNELLSALDRLYQPGFFDPDDFVQLSERLR